MTLEEVIYRMTGKTAKRHGLKGKGKILEAGMPIWFSLIMTN